MTFSPFDKRLLEEGLGYFAQPRLASLLEMLGTSEPERAEVLVTMLRNAAPDEYDEAIDHFERAGARAARPRAWAEEPRPRRSSAAAQRRAQRRQSG